MDGYSAEELCAEFGIPRTTLQWYVRWGIVPPPSRGRYARYSARAWTNLDELRRADDRHRTRSEWAEKFKSANSRSPNGTRS